MTNVETETKLQKAAPAHFRRPVYDVAEGEQDYEIRVLMPGVPKDGVHVALDGRSLKVEGSRGYRPADEWRPLFTELNWDDYRLNLELNVAVDEAAINANLENGVLRLSLPKPEEAKPRTIEIQ